VKSCFQQYVESEGDGRGAGFKTCFINAGYQFLAVEIESGVQFATEKLQINFLRPTTFTSNSLRRHPSLDRIPHRETCLCQVKMFRRRQINVSNVTPLANISK
jgi:hypothetical protein